MKLFQLLAWAGFVHVLNWSFDLRQKKKNVREIIVQLNRRIRRQMAVSKNVALI